MANSTNDSGGGNIFTGVWALMERIKEGDIDAYEELFERYFNYFITKVLPIRHPTLDEMEREDISIHALLRVLYKARQCKGKNDLSVHAWIITIVRRLAIDYLRKRDKHDIVSLDEVYDESKIGKRAFDEGYLLQLISLGEIIETLKPSDLSEQEIHFLKYYLEGYRQKDIAEKLSVSASRISQIKRKIVNYFKDLLNNK